MRTFLECADLALSSCVKACAVPLFQGPTAQQDGLNTFVSTKIQELKRIAQSIFDLMDLPLIKGVKSAKSSYKRKIEKIFAVSGAGLPHALRLDRIISFSVLQFPSPSAEFLSLINH